MTTHSTHITAIAPIESIVNLHTKSGEGTVIHATADMHITNGEFLDVERYLDMKRGEIYLGKGVILVEGIAEEYIIPRFAEIIGKSLDERGIVVCNINCTNFTPYVKLLRSLDIPYTVITDGDFYYVDDKGERVYHVSEDEVSDDADYGYLGMEVIERVVTEIGLISKADIPKDLSDADKLYQTYGIFVGNYTFEVDMMNACTSNVTATQVFIDIFDELTEGGDRQKKNFKNEINDKKYWKCLSKIEGNGIGKGRFAQKLSGRVCKEHIPDYIKEAINYICKKVDI